MRYEKIENLLQLALEMQAARGGLSLKDIEARFDVKRRTAMRMRDAILRIFPQVDEVVTDERTKRWRIIDNDAVELVTWHRSKGREWPVVAVGDGRMRSELLCRTSL